MLSVKTCLLATKTCLTYAFVTQQPFGISYWNLDTYIFVASTINIFSPYCCKCNSFGCTATIRCGSACRGPHSDSVYSGSEHNQFESPRVIKGEVGFPNPWRALIGWNQLWCVKDSPYYQELVTSHYLNQCRPDSLMHICGTRGRWVTQFKHHFDSLV